MELVHTFSVPVTLDEAFDVLTDIERVAPCMPGANVDSAEGEEFTGTVKVKVGPMQVTYRGTARYIELDRDTHRAVIEAKGRETRGSGTANATVTAEMNQVDDKTEVKVTSNLAITGRPAQFGRGVMNDVGEKLLGQFANCLADQLAGAEPSPAGEPSSAAEQAAGASARPGAPPEATQPAARPVPQAAPADEAIDLFSVAGGPVARRVAPALGILAVIAVVWWLVRRR